MFSSPIYFWLIAGLLLLLVELLTPGFVVACFGIGALLAILPAALGASVTWQVITFCIGSLLALLLLRPMVRRLNRNKETARTVAPDMVISRGEMVRIVSNDSIVMIVEPITETAE